MTTLTHEQTTAIDSGSVLQVFRNNKILQLLAALLVAQLAAAIFLSMSNNRQADFTAGEPVLAISSESIRIIEIDDGENSVSLQKNKSCK